MGLMFVFVLLGHPLGDGFAQNTHFVQVVSRYAERMQQAARSWLNKNYARALDGFYSARELLSENMPSPTDSYAWNGCCALKTYAVVLARMVEIDLYLSQGQTELAESVVEQVEEWTEILEEQMNGWSKVEGLSSLEEALRSHWMEHFERVILQAKQVSDRVVQEE